jgi:hypothetical protein
MLGLGSRIVYKTTIIKLDQIRAEYSWSITVLSSFHDDTNRTLRIFSTYILTVKMPYVGLLWEPAVKNLVDGANCRWVFFRYKPREDVQFIYGWNKHTGFSRQRKRSRSSKATVKFDLYTCTHHLSVFILLDLQKTEMSLKRAEAESDG